MGTRIVRERHPKGYTCKDCEHCYDHHERSVQGVLFMGRCPYREWSVFLFHDYCSAHFKPKRYGKDKVSKR